MDTLRFMELTSKEYWNKWYRQHVPYGNDIPIFNCAIKEDSILLYSDRHKVVILEIYNWKSKTISSWHFTKDDVSEKMWTFSGFEKLESIKQYCIANATERKFGE